MGRPAGPHSPAAGRAGRRSALLGGEVGPIGDFDGDGRGDLLGYPDAHRFEPAPRRYRTFVIRGHHWHGRR